METQMPEQMTAVILEAYEGAKALRLVQRPVPQPGPNEVLIKVAASPINPSDLMFLQGRYGFQKSLPTVPGFEGSGTVVAAGSNTGLMGKYLAGRRVACVTQQNGDGLWAEYVTTSVNFALPLAKSVSLEQGAMSVVNPLTAVALIDMAKKAGHKAVLNTAAASVLGQMMVRLGQQEGVEVISVVRREEQAALLKQQGARQVFNSSEPDFARQLHDFCHQHKVRLAFDAIADEMPQTLLNAMPPHSKVTIYGGLSQRPLPVHYQTFIFKDQTVDGFWLTTWVGQKSFWQSLRLWQKAQKLMQSALKTEVRARYPLQNAPEAVTEYETQMTGGKVLLTVSS